MIVIAVSIAAFVQVVAIDLLSLLQFLRPVGTTDDQDPNDTIA